MCGGITRLCFLFHFIYFFGVGGHFSTPIMISWVSTFDLQTWNQCCGSGYWIRIFSIPDPHQRIKYFNPKNSFQALGTMIRVVHPGSRIRNTAWNDGFLAGGGGGAQQGGGGPADGGEVALQPDLLRRQRLRGWGAPASLVIFIPSTNVAVRSRTFLRLSGCGTIRSGSGTSMSDSNSTYVLLVSIA